MPEHPNFYAIREDSIMIFYFTGTGNSLYAAKQLDSDCRSIPEAMHKKGEGQA